MSSVAPNPLPIQKTQVQSYLQSRGYLDAEIVAFEPLGASIQERLKGYGYGRPVRVRFSTLGGTRDVVIRTARPDRFGHDRRSDRLEQMALSFEAFRHVPQHIEAHGFGVFDEDGRMHEIPPGEPFLVTDYVEGVLYAHDLKGLETQPVATSMDLARARYLAHYLAELHRQPAPASAYVRCIRDTVGSGEGIFGLVDNYPSDCPRASWSRLERIEQAAVTWRRKLRRYESRARRTHGDFHPFNLLFREGTDFSVLDCSRGGVGEPADDVTALSINYLFFSLMGHGEFRGALRQLWEVFWSTYLEETQDQDVLSVVAPFFAWRALVVACPAWYPSVSPPIRDQILRFAERLLAGASFRPDRVEDLWS